MALQHADVPALLSAVESIWPGLQAESLVKRAAAIYLLQQPGFRQKGVVVASHVTETVGKIKELGIEQGFEKLLDSDPCFTVDKSLANSLVTLNTSQVLLQHQWRQDEQEQQQQQHWQLPDAQDEQQQQQHWQLPHNQVSAGQDAAAPAAAQGPLHVRATPRLLQRLNEYWPLQGPKATPHSIVKHKALYHLLQAPEHSYLRSSLAHDVKAALGKSIKEVGCTVPFSQVLMEEPNIFVLGPGPTASEATVSLNVPGVLDTFVRWRYHQAQHSTDQHPTAHEGTSAVQAGPPVLPLQQQQQQQVLLLQQQQQQVLSQQQQPAPAVDAVAEPGVVSAGQLLRYVRSRQWHGDPILDEARRALAIKLVLKANPTFSASDQPANTDTKRYSMLGALAGHTIAKGLESYEPGLSTRAPSLEQAVDQDPYLSLHLVGSVYHIRIDVGQLLQDAATAAHASTALQHHSPAGAQGASSSSSTGLEGAAPARAALSYDTANGQAAAADYTALPVQTNSAAAAGGSGDSSGGTAPAQQVSSAALLGYVQRRCWHKSDPRLDLARRTVAVFIVEQANSGVDSDKPAKSSAKAYTQTFVQAGIRVNKALRARFGNDMKSPYKKFADIFEGDPCWSTFPSGFTQSCVQLQVQHLLQEMTGTQSSPAHIAGSGSSSSRGVTSQTGGQCMIEASRPSSAASASTTSSRKQAAGASPAISSAGAGGSGAGAAEAAAAAIQAAAKSLMPPLVKSSKAPSPAAAAAAADSAVAAAAGVDVHPGSCSTTTAAAAAGGELLPVSPAAAESAQQEPFLPPWLQLCKAGTSSTHQQAAAGTPQQQQQQQALGSSAGQAGLTAGHLDQAALQQATQQQQQEQVQVHGSADVEVQPMLATAAGSAARMAQADNTPVQYELQFDNSIPGWYTAKYVPYDTTAGSPAAEAAAAGADAAAMQDSAAGSAGTDTAAESDSCAGSAVLEAAAAGAEGLPAAAAGEAADAADVPSDAASAAGESAAAAGEQPAPAAAEGPVEPHGALSTDKDTVQEPAAAAAAGPSAAAPAGAEDDAASPEAAVWADTGAAAAAGAAVDTDAVGGVDGANAAAEQGLQSLELQGLLQALPDKLHPELLPHLSRPPGHKPCLSRILISRGQPVTLRFSNRTALTLKTHVTLSEALQQLLAAQQQWTATQQQQQQEGPQQADMVQQHTGLEAAADPAKQGSSSSSESAGAVGNSSSTMNGDVSGQHDQHGNHSNSSSSGSKAAAPAAAAAADHSTLQRAAATLFSSSGSGRVGIPFSCHRVCAVYDAAGGISGLTYCIDTQPPGSAQGLADVLSSMKASLMVQQGQQEEDGWTGMDRPHSLLLLGRPGVGKASLLRDICRLMSEPPDAGGLGLDVMLIDTTGQVAGVAAEPCLHIGSARLLSAPAMSQQAQMMFHAAVQHQPDVLVVAELNTQQDVGAAVHIARSSNVLLVAAAPAAASLQQLLADATLCPLVGCERAVTRDGSSSCSSQLRFQSPGLSRIAAVVANVLPVQSHIQAVRPSPFAVALELISSNRWCLHADLPATISSLLAEGAAISSASGSHMKLSQQPYPHSQLRSWDVRGHLQVTFKEAADVQKAVAEAALVTAISQHEAATGSE